MECADFLLCRKNEGDESEGIPTIYRGIQFAQAGLIRLVFPSGAKINDASGLLEGDYTGGRRPAVFYSAKDVKAKDKALRAIITKWLELLEK